MNGYIAKSVCKVTLSIEVETHRDGSQIEAVETCLKRELDNVVASLIEGTYGSVSKKISSEWKAELGPIFLSPKP
jgi:hypothetical protein